MADCPFCKIIAGDLSSSFVYKDEVCSAIMDIQPVNAGHVLLMPNEHIADLAGLPPETASHIFLIAQKLAFAVRQSGVQCEGINLFLADGKAAMQEVPHFHLHIIPRFEGDGFGFQFSPRYAELPTREELDANAHHIKQALEGLSPGDQQL
ncbi:MAG TPA: HIT family protein [Chloroflexi bacterium]|nr:MAG: HIT family protein [Chloroflexota bacterium]HDD54695.1 HIT family protein [Chloroflexota bacterium]